MKDKKRVFNKFSFYDRTHMQAYLEDMAAQGWMLEKVGTAFWHFKRCEARKLHFSVNYFPEASEFDPEPTEQLLTIREFCAHAGWEFVTGTAQMQIYCNEQDDPTPIETDAMVELNTIHKAMKKNFLPSQIVMFGLGLLQLALQFNIYCINPINFWSGSSNLFGVFCWIAVLLISGAEIFGYLRWHNKAKRAAEEDGVLLFTPNHRWFQNIMLIIIFIGFAIWYVTLQDNQLYLVTIVMFLAMAAIFWMTTAIMNFMKRKKVSAKVSRILTVGVSFLLGMALMVGVVFLMIQTINWGIFEEEPRYEYYEYRGHNFRVYNDEMPLEISDLTGLTYDNYSTRWDVKESIFLGKYDGLQSPRIDALGGGPSLRYEVYDVKWSALYDTCLHELLHQYDDRYEDDIPMEWRENFRAIDATSWHANAVYQEHAGDVPSERYILCYDTVIVEFIPGWELTEAQKAIVAEKLGR